MKQTKTRYLVSTLLVTYGAFTAFAALLLQYPAFYKAVVAPGTFKQAYLTPMTLIGFVLFALVLGLAWLLRIRFEASPRFAGIPTALFGVATALLTIATPYGINVLGRKMVTLAPTAEQYAQAVSYILFLIAMALGGLAAACILFRHMAAETRKGAANVLYPLFFLLCAVTAGAMNFIIPSLGYERFFIAVGVVCAACALLSLLLGWRKSEQA